MTTVENQRLPASSSSYPADNYDPDDVRVPGSPLLQAINPKLEPSPSPEPMVLPPAVTFDSNRKGPYKPKNRASLSDAVLVHFMDDGKHVDIARRAGDEPLASDDEDDAATEKGVSITVTTEHIEDVAEFERRHAPVKDEMDRAPSEHGAVSRAADAMAAEKDGDLEALASSALSRIDRELPQAHAQVSAHTNGLPHESSKPRAGGESMDGLKSTAPSITTTHVEVIHSQTSPDINIKAEIQLSSPTGELPPIQHHPSHVGLSNGSGAGPITLPSLIDQLGDLNRLPDIHTPRDSSTFSQSPPAPPPPLFASVPGHGSPPKSPNDLRSLPSPAFFSSSTYRRPSQAEPPQYSSAGEYSSSNTETPSTEGSAPTPIPAIDRMSIDGITNPQIGGFQCTYPGCNAQPFQTQYLLNSHANVHSQIRPHYCAVKGCPRSEGGKGFKRKNEMIRHGLVHDSPGYVCPFCPDREHKYPRPDNLQRHVRVHHVDKDKDDPLLRDVLSQRPEGPSRGRRRRGGTT